MTRENRKENILEEMERASQIMDAASLLFENDLVNDAVSRLYYFLLYNIRALLLTKGFEPRRHEGALRLFGLHFTSILSPEGEAVQMFLLLMGEKVGMRGDLKCQMLQPDLWGGRCE